jgi:hypothetical protein
MRIARRLFGLLGGAAGAIGLVLCVAGIVACWWLHGEATRRADRTFGRVEDLLADVRDNLGQARDRLRQTQAELDSVRERESNLAAQPPAERNARRALSRKAMTAIDPQLGDARGKLVRATEVGLVLRGVLDALAEIPLVERAGANADRLRESSTQLSELIQKADKLAGSLTGSPAEAPDASTADESSRLAEGVGRLVAALDEESSRADRAREATAERRSQIGRWITVAAAIVTVVLVWIGLGQFSLLGHGWKWATRRSV